tara:strand:- start:155 stop:544 length:390 start_codon:yes stop_codon:yes gene_type:complete
VEPKRLLIAIPIFAGLLGTIALLRPALQSIDEYVVLVGLSSGFAATLFSLWLINFVAVSDSEYADIPGKKQAKDRTFFWVLSYLFAASFLYFSDDWTSQFVAGFLMAVATSLSVISCLDKLRSRNERTH